YIIGEYDFQLTLSVLYSLLFVISGAVFSRLLEVTSMEVEMNKEIDADNELLGIAKTYLFSSLIGAGFITRYAGADIAAATKNGTQSKFFSIMGFCLPLLLCTVSPYFYLFIPKFVILAIFVKVLFLTTWRILLLPLLTLHLKEKIIMLIGMVFVLNTGLMPGTFYTGILHFVIFAIEYMRCKIVKAKFSLDMIQSNTQRDLIDNMLLGTYGHKTIVWLLQGYVFFGNAYNLKMQLLKLIKDRIAENNPIDAVIIDFKAVQGTDTDIIYNIKTIYQVLNRFNVILCVCYPNLEKNALNEKNLHIFNYLDECLLWNENRIIAAFTSADHAKANPLDKILPNKEDQEILKEFADIRTLNPYNMLYLEKSTIQSIFFLMEGEVNLMFTGDISSGGQLFSQIVLAGNFVGEGEVFLDAVARSTAITKSKSVILELRMDRLAEIQQRHPHLVNILYRYILSDCFYRMDRSKSLSSEILGFSNNA
ncbi:STAS domain-containing protein, partial [bacterium]|nr:STAS domain-containing protein [bacterium]